MWKFNRQVIFLTFCIAFPSLLWGQKCNLTLGGKVVDIRSSAPIGYANIFVKEVPTGSVSDSLGSFSIKNLCPGVYHITISHIGCEAQDLFLEIKKDTLVSIYLDHNSQLLHEVSVLDKVGQITTQETQSLNSKSIAQNSNKNLATMLESISGVSSLKNGGGIAKPVVHGLYGNRLIIANNGIVQSGQQWGVDHSPAIDPLVANRITVIKGVGAVEFQGSSLGSVVLVEPKKISNEPHLHGHGRYFFESNGRGNGLNIDLQKSSDILAWRIMGTVKKSGDKRAPSYFLNNTGSQEAHLAIQLEKSWNSQWISNVYLSSFNADLGILRGSQIGNLTDLEEALERDVPFYTEETFSYDIEAPYQRVNHNLLKLSTQYRVSDVQWFDFTYAGQYNLRKEFDVRRGGRSDKPAMSLQQNSNFLEAKYLSTLYNNWQLKGGIQFNRIENKNLPETGILPLIPDYLSYKYGVYGMLSKRFEKTTLEVGGRYDFEAREVAAISNTVPREVVRYQNNYQNTSIMLGVTHDLSSHWKLTYNLGFAERNPEVNELYSNGLHQGVGGIEEGDPNLQKESSLKNTLSIKGKPSDRWVLEGLGYYQAIDNYIFLNPQDEIRLTIRGAFPVYKYEQTKARITGFDLAATYRATERFNITGKYSFLYGYNLSENLPLINMPSNNAMATLRYQIPKWGAFDNVEFQINNNYVFEQKKLLPSQDYAPAPDAYFLLGAKATGEIQWEKLRFNLFIKGENILNQTYRDYLNRQRYFADDTGINIILGCSISF